MPGIETRLKGIGIRRPIQILYLPMFLARIFVKLKESILDPQGQAVIHALHNLGHEAVSDVRVGKYIEVRLKAADQAAAEKEVREYCDRLLSNPVIETYEIEIQAAGS